MKCSHIATAILQCGSHSGQRQLFRKFHPVVCYREHECSGGEPLSSKWVVVWEEGSLCVVESGYECCERVQVVHVWGRVWVTEIVNVGFKVKMAESDRKAQSHCRTCRSGQKEEKDKGVIRKWPLSTMWLRVKMRSSQSLFLYNLHLWQSKPFTQHLLHIKKQLTAYWSNLCRYVQLEFHKLWLLLFMLIRVFFFHVT